MQISPIIIKVAVPLEKHSDRLGQLASSQTEARDLFLRISLVFSIFGLCWILTLSQSGFRGSVSVGITFIGIRLTFSAPLSFSPAISLFLSAKVSPVFLGLVA